MAVEGLISKIKSGINSAQESEVESDENSELPEPEDALPADPKPVRGRASSVPKRAPAPTKAVRQEVRDALVMMMTIPAGLVSFRDPICGGAVLDHADKIADSLVPIICRNPRMLAWFTTGSGYMDFLGVAMAFWPLVSTVYGHHVSHSIGHDHEEAEEASDFSQYSAPAFYQAP